MATNLIYTPSDGEISAIKGLTNDARADLAARINSTSPFSLFDSVEGKEGKQIICPNCGSGSGKNRTGVTPTYENGKWIYNCFACGGFHGDLISIIADANNLSTNGTDFFSVLAIAAKVTGQNIFGGNVETATKTTQTTKKEKPVAQVAVISPQLQNLIVADIEEGKANFEKLPSKEKRGLTDETLKTFQIGVIFNWTPPQNRLDNQNLYPSPRVIIPHLTSSALPNIPLTYCAALFLSERETLESQGKTFLKYLYGGNRTPFGLNTLKPADKLFAVEGEYDALSIWQATGGLFPCLATGGTAFNGIFDALEGFYTENKPVIYFLADNDNAGKNLADKFCNAAKEKGFIAVAVSFAPLDAPKSDANKILIEQGNSALADKINSLIEGAQGDLDNAAAEIEIDNLRDAPIKLKLPDGFKIQAEKLIYNESTVSYTPPLVTKKFWQGDRVFYEVAFLVGGSWKKIIVSADSLFDKLKLVSLSKFGLAVNTVNSKTMCLYFVNLTGINADIIPVEILYSQGGWTDDSCSEFIYPNDLKVYGNNFDYNAAFKICGDEEKFNNILLKALKESYVACLVVGVAVAAPLIKPLSISNKQLHLGCRSGNGKTAIIKLALAIFGNPKFLMSKFNATSNALENFSVALNDFPSGIDELQSINKFQRDFVDELLYNFENGRIRARLTRQGTFQPFKYFSGCRITTGEQPLTTEFSNEGAKKRCVEITDNKILREELAVEVHRLTGKNYGLHGRLWTDFIKNHIQLIESDYDAAYNEMYNHYRRAFPEHISLVAVAQVALKHFCTLIFPVADTEKILDTFDVDKIFEQLPLRQEMQNGKRAIMSVAELYASHEKYFPTIKADGTVTTSDRAPNDIYGYVLKNGNLFVFTKNLRDCLKEFPNFQAIVRDFSELGFLDESKDNLHKHQKHVKIDKKYFWGYVFKKEALFDEAATCERKPHEEIKEDEGEESVDDGYSFEED